MLDKKLKVTSEEKETFTFVQDFEYGMGATGCVVCTLTFLNGELDALKISGLEYKHKMEVEALIAVLEAASDILIQRGVITYGPSIIRDDDIPF